VLDWAAVSRPTDDDASLLERATHDLLNPVSSILGLAETIRQRGSALGEDTLKQFGESMAKQSIRLESGLRDLIRATILLRGDPEVSLESVHLGDVVAGTAAERVRVSVAPDSKLQADPLLLADAMRRLIENALEFSTGQVVVTGGDGWLEVADEGTGFTPEGLARALEPLSAGANATNERSAGLGLGLYIARRLVEAMGGTLTATSEPGRGSVFRIALPG
jgi:signal transduction histidine kinase